MLIKLFPSAEGISKCRYLENKIFFDQVYKRHIDKLIWWESFHKMRNEIEKA